MLASTEEKITSLLLTVENQPSVSINIFLVPTNYYKLSTMQNCIKCPGMLHFFHELAHLSLNLEELNRWMKLFSSSALTCRYYPVSKREKISKRHI